MKFFKDVYAMKLINWLSRLTFVVQTKMSWQLWQKLPFKFVANLVIQKCQKLQSLKWVLETGDLLQKQSEYMVFTAYISAVQGVEFNIPRSFR